MNMNRTISQKFRFYSFVCIVLLMLVHGYNLKQAYLQPFTSVYEDLTFTTFIEYFLANGALRFRIPMLFIISGYIYAMQDYKPYIEQATKRFSSLMIPYFIWSAIGLAITFLLQLYPYTAQLVQQALVDQLGDNRPYTQIGWGGVLFRWVVVPTSFQLWFIRSLFIYNLMYPVFRWLVKRYPAAWFAVVFVLWYLGFQLFYIEGQGMLFFTLGIWLQKSNFPLDKQPGWYSNYLAWLLFLGTSIIKTFMAFELEPNTPLTFWVLITLHVVTILSGIVAVWYGADTVVRWCMKKRWFVWATSFSFVIYGLHVPVIIYLTMYLFDVWGNVPNYRLLTYFTAPIIVLAICISFGALMRSLAPKLYRITTGGRGF